MSTNQKELPLPEMIIDLQWLMHFALTVELHKEKQTFADNEVVLVVIRGSYYGIWQ